MSYHIGDQLEIKIEKIVPNGLGMGFAEKLTVFVPESAPGDVVSVEIRQIKGRTAFAAILKVFEASPDRTEPPCEYYGTCGGCNFQHIKYSAQLTAKVDMIRDCLTRIAHIEYTDEIGIIPSPNEFGYRLRTQFHASSGKIGFFRRQSHEIEDIKRCMVLTDGMNVTLAGLRDGLTQHISSDGMMNIESAAAGGESSFYSEEIIEPTRDLAIEVSGEKFEFNARSFFQGNEPMLQTLTETVVGDESGETAYDLYCGAGLFSIPLAKKFKVVSGIEVNPESLRFALRNGKNARLENLEFFEGRVSEFLDENKDKKADLIVLDPPRSGVKTKTLEKIAKACSGRIVYVSCNPSTLARDLAVLIEKGFVIEKITALDLFPQTHHVETVVKLARLKVEEG